MTNTRIESAAREIYQLCGGPSLHEIEKALRKHFPEPPSSEVGSELPMVRGGGKCIRRNCRHPIVFDFQYVGGFVLLIDRNNHVFGFSRREFESEYVQQEAEAAAIAFLNGKGEGKS